MGDFQHEHRAHGRERAGEVFGPVDDEGGLQEVRGADIDIESSIASEMFDEYGYDWYMSVELYLSRHVDDDQILLSERIDGF